MNNFVIYYVLGVRIWQIGGKVIVIQNGIVVFVMLFYQVCFIVILVIYYLVIIFLDVGIFGVQICLVFWFFEDYLVIVVMDIIECINGLYWFWLFWCLFLMELYFVGLQMVVILYDIYVVSKYGVIWVVFFCVVSIDSYG